MIKNSDIYNMDNRIYNTRDQNENQNSGQKKGPGRKVRKLFRDIKKLKTNENQNSGQKKGPGKGVRKLFRDIKKLKTYVEKLKVKVSNLKFDNNRLRRKVDMLTVQNNELLKNKPTSDNKQNQSQNLQYVGFFYPYFMNNINNQNQQKHPLSLNSPIFIPKNKNQTSDSYNRKENVNNPIDVSSSKFSFENKSDNNEFHFDKKTNSRFNIENLRTESEKVKKVSPEKPNSLSEKLKDIKSISEQKINQVPNIALEQEKF